jgi:hypothetical protein
MSTTVVSHPFHRHTTHDSGAPGRAIHFVGSLPPEVATNDRDSMQWFLDYADGHALTTLPCDRDPRWIIDWLDNLATIPALHITRAGKSTSYTDMPTYDLAPGHQLKPSDVTLGRVSEVTAVMAARNQLYAAGELPPHQVSIPNALDLAMFCFGAPKPALVHLPVFRDAILADVTEIHDRWGSEVILQLETPAVLVLFDRTPRRLWPALAFALARQTAQLITSAPQSTRWTLHLCYGDLGHEPLAQPADLVPVVQYLNALHRRLTKLDVPMPQAHIPMCTGTTGPPTNPRFYRALSHLRTGIEVIAGLVDETHPDDSRTALRLVEDELGYRVKAVAAACGLGRRSERAAIENALLTRELAHAHTGHPAI